MTKKKAGLQLELNGLLISEHPDIRIISETLSRMHPGSDHMLTLHRPPSDFVQVTGDSNKGFVLNAYEDAKGFNFFSKKLLKTDRVVHILKNYLDANPHWTEGFAWQSGNEKQQKAQRRIPGLAGLIAFGIFATAYFAAGVMIWKNQPLGFTWKDYTRGWIGITVIAGYIGWIDFFFSWLRPRLARWLGAKFDLHITESMRLYDAGTWDASGGNVGKRALIYALDIFILIFSVMLPIAIPVVMALILFGK
jgi:hypothetical protein